MNPEDFFGLQARGPDGTRFGRITEVYFDEVTGEPSYVVAQRGAESFEVPISSVSLDPEVDFAVFHADRSDVGPNDHVGDDDDEERAIYEPARWQGHENAREAILHETVEDPDGEVVGPAERAREDWEDASYDPGSGYPRNDVYIDPATGEEVDPLVRDDEGLAYEVEELLAGTGLRARSVSEGSVEVEGRAASPGDLGRVISELEGLAGVVEVDATDADAKGTK